MVVTPGAAQPSVELELELELLAHIVPPVLQGSPGRRAFPSPACPTTNDRAGM
jgi:hypothetical protein